MYVRSFVQVLHLFFLMYSVNPVFIITLIPFFYLYVSRPDSSFVRFFPPALSTFFHVLRTGLSLATPDSEPLVISSAIPYILLCFWFADKRVPLHQQPLSVYLSIYSTYASFAQHRLKHQYVCADLFFCPYPSYLPRNHTLIHNTRSLFGRQLTCVSLSQRH